MKLGLLPFFCHHNTKKLVFKTFRGDHEVKQAHFGGQLRQIMRVPQLCCDVKAKVRWVLDHTFSQSDTVHATYREDNSDF